MCTQKYYQFLAFIVPGQKCFPIHSVGGWLVVFYGISTQDGYLMPNPVIYDL